MRLVRCDACGAKAMLAASQCPKCRHPLYVRNDLGKSVPLARCRGCDTFYPESRGACRWCTVPERPFNVSRFAAGVAVVVVLSGAGWQAWRVRSVIASKAAEFVAQLAARKQNANGNPGAEARPVLAAAPVPTPAPAPAQPAPDTSAGSATVSEPAPNVDALQSAAGGSGTIYARAITWANVRAERDLASVVIGVILPDSVVEIVESRGGWRRVSTAGIAGWADHRFFAIDSTRRRKG